MLGLRDYGYVEQVSGTGFDKIRQRALLAPSLASAHYQQKVTVVAPLLGPEFRAFFWVVARCGKQHRAMPALCWSAWALVLPELRLKESPHAVALRLQWITGRIV